MEASAVTFVEKRIWIGSLMEALAVETVLAAGKCLVWLVKVTESLLTDVNHSVSPKFTPMDGRFPLDELVGGKHAFVECKDASDEDDDEDDQDEEDQDDDDAGDEDFSGEGEEEADPEDDPEANGAGGSDDGEEDDDEDGDEDDDEDAEEDDDEEEEEEDEDDEEVPQPPAKKRK